jgi:hypothetical protein
MATAYHRRPWPSGRDIAALAHIKIGNGSAWQGYYMYAGGTNPSLDLEESHATGYPNDMARLSYDFHAPIGQSGDLSEGSALLRGQHAFLDAFGALLGDLPSALPEVQPGGLDDTETLRWAVRSDGATGFVFLSSHQPHIPLRDTAEVQLRIGSDLVLPTTPITVPGGTVARWPVGLPVGDATVSWATASVLTLLPGDVPTLVLVADEAVPVELAIAGDAPRVIEPSWSSVRVAGADILVLPASAAASLWVRNGTDGRMLLHSEAELAWGSDGPMRVRSRDDEPTVRAYDPATREWMPVGVAPRAVGARETVITPVLLSEAEFAHVPADYGFVAGRHSAPTIDDINDLAAIYRLDLPEWAFDPDHDAVLEIDWAGDVGQLRIEGRIADDRYWDGSRWTASVQDMRLHEGEVILHLLPLSADSTVWVPEAAAARRAAARGPLLALDAVRVISRGRWREAIEPG